MKKIALIYGHEPSGHVTAALAVAEKIRSLGGEPVFVDLSRVLYKRSGPAVSGVYLKTLERVPFVWDAVYDLRLLSAPAAFFRKIFFARAAEKLAAVLRGLGAEAAVCTHSMPCVVLSAGKPGLPVFAVVTDFTAHGFWPARGVDGYFVHDETAALCLSRLGAPGGKITLSGIPVREAFVSPRRRGETLAALGLNQSRPVALVCGGSKGMGAMEACVKTLSEIDGLGIIAICGANKGLKLRLETAKKPGLKILGNEAEPADAMAAADFIAGKPGGVTAAEALALAKPFLIFSPLPGQERRNARYLVSNGAALLAENKAELARAAAALASDKTLRQRLSGNARRLSKPDSAEIIARSALKI